MALRVVVTELDAQGLTGLVIDSVARALPFGADALIDELERQTRNWEHDTEFEKSKPVAEAEEVEIDVLSDDPIFHWVDQGTDEISFSVRPPRKMVFQFQGRGQSYDAKTDGGSGQQRGPRVRRTTINARSIKPRRIVDQAIEDWEDDIWNAVQGNLY